MSNNNFSDQEEGIISSLMYKFLPFWPLFALLAVIGIGGAKAYLHYTLPVYESTATVIIKDGNKGVDDFKIMESMNVFTSKKIVENEIEVINSRTLMNKVVEDLDLYASTFEDKGRLTTSAYLSSPVSIKLKQPQKISKDGNLFSKIYFTFESVSNTVLIDNKRYPLEEWVESPYGVIMFIANEKKRIDPSAPLYFSLTHPSLVTNQLLANLSVSATSKLSTVVELSYRDQVPERGEDILNHLLYHYKQSSVIDRNILAANTLAFIEERIKATELEIDDIEKEVENFKSSKGAVDLSEQGKLFLQNSGDNTVKIADYNLQLAVLDKVEKYVVSKDDKASIVPSTLGVNDPVLAKLLDKLYEAELEYEKLKKTTARNNPILVSIANEIEKIRPSILENVQNQRESLRTSLTNLKQTTNRYQSVLQAIPQKERELLEISRKRTIKNELYSFLLQKREEAALSYAPSTGDSRVVDMAESSVYPVNSKPLQIYGMAILAALGLGFAFVVGKEMLSDKVLYRSEIEDKTSIPVIGELYYCARKMSDSNGYNNRFIADQFREIRIALGLHSRTLPFKKLLVTSSIEGEGKSYVSENIAIGLAASGKKVVLVNFDLLKTSSSQIFDFDKQKGISEYLAGGVKPIDLINPTMHDNLFVITAGAFSDTTSDALLDADLTALFSFLEDSFDYVIVDTPPIGVASDASLLLEYCDTVVYIVRHRYTPIKILERIEKSFRNNDLKNINIVFNGLKTRGFGGKYGYGYRYGYSYGYSYGGPQKKIRTSKKTEKVSA